MIARISTQLCPCWSCSTLDITSINDEKCGVGNSGCNDVYVLPGYYVIRVRVSTGGSTPTRLDLDVSFVGA